MEAAAEMQGGSSSTGRDLQWAGHIRRDLIAAADLLIFGPHLFTPCLKLCTLLHMHRASARSQTPCKPTVHVLELSHGLMQRHLSPVLCHQNGAGMPCQ